MARSGYIKFLLGILLALTLLGDSFILSGCANMVPPSGGPRDSLPPRLLEVSPPDSSTNFNAGRITFLFDEFVEVNNVMQNLIVSPTPKTMPVVESKLRTITVRIKDTLEANTTYSLDFGNAIRDINESNELKGFTYIFTTGEKFDTLELRGRVLLAETGGTDSTLIVMLHTNLDDSAVIKDRPRYYTRVSPQGEFNFRYLPQGRFALYVLKDESGTRRYLSKSQVFGFADAPVQTGGDSVQFVTLYAYREQADNRPAGTTTTNNRAPRPNATQDKLLRFQTNIENDQLDLLKDLEIRFTTPLRVFDTTKVRFTDESFNTLPRARFELDTSRKLVTLDFPWTGNTPYNIVVQRDFAEDTLGRKIPRDDTLSFRTRKEGDYGSLKLRFLNLDMARNPVLLFVQNEQVAYTHVFTDRNVNIPLFAPGDYELRILYDENRNGKWDPGEFFGKHRQPERVQPLPRRLTVKPNWDNEIDITL